MRLKEYLEERGASGNVTVMRISDNAVTCHGSLSGITKEELHGWLRKNYDKVQFIIDNCQYNKLTVKGIDEPVSSTASVPSDQLPLDEVGIIYQGMIDTELITPDGKGYKNFHLTNKLKVENWINVFNVMVPIIVDKHLKIIDGERRHGIAEEQGVKKVPVMILDCEEPISSALRLGLNRSNEFQRWNYVNVDDFVDAQPVLQPLLEPFGFFGRYILPETFFSNSMTSYVIDPYNEKQKAYKQEVGLAEWAKYRREKMQQNAEARMSLPKKDKSQCVSIFDLIPKEEDFLDTYDIDEEIDKQIEDWKDTADKWDKQYEAMREAGEAGRISSGNRRTPREVAIDNFISVMQESDLFDEDELISLKENYKEDYVYMTPEEVKEAL